MLHLTIDRPEVRNAFNDELIAELTSAFDRVGSESSGSEDAIRAVVLAGAGKAFCAGGDLEWMRKAAAYSEEENFRDAMSLAGLFSAVANCPVPVVARVHGAAFGGGCGLVAASDVAICDSDSKFAFSEVKLGLLPGTISPFVIPRIGAGHARALFVTGEPFGAEHALRIGLVHQVVNAESLDEAVEATLSHILVSGPRAVREAKRIVLDAPVSIEDSARRLARARASAEGKEGVAAFLEKRRPSWASEG